MSNLDSVLKDIPVKMHWRYSQVYLALQSAITLMENQLITSTL